MSAPAAPARPPSSRPPSAGDVEAATAAAITAATAAAAVLPAGAPLEVGPPTRDPRLVVLPGQAVGVRLAGAIHGELVAVVGQDLVDALAGSPLGPLDLAAALGPALEAAVAPFGPVVIEPAGVADPADAVGALAAKGDAVFVPLHDGESVRAAIGLVLTSAPPEPPGAGTPAVRPGPAAAGRGLDLLHDVEMEVTAELGHTRLTVRELLALVPGSVVELDRLAGSPADLLVNGRLIACGEVVVVDENFGLRITDIFSPAERT